MNIKVPDSLLNRARELARREDLTLEQLINSALAEKMAALMTLDYLKERAARGDRRKFHQALEGVPDVEPDAADALP
ncbi:MAG: toxin-antitoxin system HicB family antitoxin [Acidobacteriota bacterium]|nr:toxin-antitoxin system HicB family antitoxin [Acidobacteriota bacterium]